MILFEKDFREQNAYIHSNTKNQSFLHMYAVLKAMGIKNNAFFLAITQKELMDIDPHNLKDPSPELAARIAYEASVNPWYAIRELIRIPSAGSDPIRYILNRANLALNWSVFNSIDAYLVQARQTGKSISTCTNISVLKSFVVKNYAIGTFAKDNDLRMRNIERIKDITDTLPKYLIYKTAGDKNNAESIKYAARNVVVDSGVAQPSIGGADNLGRGMSYPFVWLDEFEYFKNIQITYPVLMATMNAVSKQARANNLPTSVILTSTAGRLEEESCKFAISVIDKAMRFTESVYDCPDVDTVRAILEANSQNNMFYIEYSYLQLGYTNKWLEETIKKLSITDQAVIDRDFLNIRKSGKDASVLTQVLLDKLQRGKQEPITTEITDAGYILRWYKDPKEVLKNDEPYIIGLDSSENVGNDFTEIYMINATDMSVVMCTRCNESSVIKLAIWVANFMVTYPNSILVPERKSTGSMIVALISEELRKHNMNPFTRIFNQVVQHINEEPFSTMDIYEHNAHEGKLKKYLGYPTAGSGEYSRNALYKDTLIRAVETNHTRIYDAHLITQISSLSVKGGGRLDHSSAGHDDAVIAYLLACWFIYYGKNHNYYSINSAKFLSKISSTGEEVDTYYKEAQLEICRKMEVLKEASFKAKDEISKNYLKREIERLEKQIDPSIIEEVPITIEQYNKQLNTSRIRLNPNFIAGCM